MVGVVRQLIGEVERLQKENEKLNARLAALKVENGLSAAPVDHRCGVWSVAIVSIVAWLYTSQSWGPSREWTVLQHTEGPCSSIQSGSGNTAYVQQSREAMRHGIVCLLIMLAGAAPAIAVEVDQSTTGWSSPIQSGNNNVVNCTGVDPRAETYLNDLLDRVKLDLKQKTAEANEWARRYLELNAQLEETKKQLAAKGEDATLVQTAQDLLHEGELAKAHAMFDRLIKFDEANVDRAALPNAVLTHLKAGVRSRLFAASGLD